MTSRSSALAAALSIALTAAAHAGQAPAKPVAPAPAADTAKPVAAASPALSDTTVARMSFQSGIAAYKKGDIASAETQLTTSVQHDATDGDAQGWLGFILLKRDKPEAAIPHLEKAIALKPEVPDHYTNLGNALLLKPGHTPADSARAIEMFRKAVVASHQSEEAQYNLGLAFTRMGKQRDAATAYRWATQMNPKDDRAFLSLAQTDAALGDWDNAAAAFRSASALTPQRADVWNSLGIAESKRLYPDRTVAINALETGRKLDGGTVATLVLLGKLYAAENRPADAAEAFGAGADKLEASGAPEAAAVRYNQAVVLARAGNDADALTAYNKALALKPDYFDAAFNSGTLLYKGGKFKEAVTQFDLATKADPTSAIAWTNKGLAALKGGDPAAAIVAWKRTIALRRDDYVTRDALAGLLADRKSYEEAIALYQQNARLQPHSGLPWNAIGLIYQKQDDLDNALTAFQTATKREPRLAAAYNNLGVVYEKRAQFKLAVASYKKALALDPNFSDARANLARYGAKTSASNSSLKP